MRTARALGTIFHPFFQTVSMEFMMAWCQYNFIIDNLLFCVFLFELRGQLGQLRATYDAVEVLILDCEEFELCFQTLWD